MRRADCRRHGEVYTNAGIMRWNKINQKMNSMTAYDLFPWTITIAGDTAIAHYYYSVARSIGGRKTCCRPRSMQ